MDIYKINLDNVSIKSDKYNMRTYANSTRGRAQLEAECTADIVQAVYKVWGDKPTVTEPTPVKQGAPTPSTAEKQLAAMTLNQVQYAAAITALQKSNAALMLKLAGGNT